MPRFLRDLQIAAHLSPADWYYIATATKELLFARLRHAVRPAQEIVVELHRSANSQKSLRPASPLVLGRVAWAIRAAANRVPWRSDCLLQVMAADRWLSRAGHTRQFFLGANFDIQDAFSAHAWLTCNGFLVAGFSDGVFVPLIEPARN